MGVAEWESRSCLRSLAIDLIGSVAVSDLSQNFEIQTYRRTSHRETYRPCRGDGETETIGVTLTFDQTIPVEIGTGLDQRGGAAGSVGVIVPTIPKPVLAGDDGEIILKVVRRCFSWKIARSDGRPTEGRLVFCTGEG